MKQQVNAVTVTSLTKSFHIPLEAHSGIKQKLINTLKGRKGYRVFTPLKDLTFDIKEGEFFGIVGRNGSGKSTLLKTLAGIYTPNKGAVQITGSLVPFIELGVGFNPELTGRENVFLNGALLGFSRRRMEEMYDDIVSFAELQDFMEERLKNYSSGMQVRLAFSIAIRAEADILLLDEVLAVGDEAFQRKCFSYFDQLRRKKKTVILVTHDMAAVERFCTRAMFIEEGEISLIGSPREVAAAYSRSNDESYEIVETPEESTESVAEEPRSRIKIEITDQSGKVRKKFTSGDTVRINLTWEDEGVNYVGVAILKQSGEYIFGPSTYQDGYKIKTGAHEISYEVKLNVGEGDYFIKAGLYGSSDMDRIDFQDNGPTFVVNRDKDDVRWGGVTKLEYSWKE